MSRLKAGLMLVFLAVFVGLSAGSASAAGAPPARASATSASAVAAQGNSEQARQPAATSEQEEHTLSPKPDQIARPFGFPITNSMVVSWVVALGLIIFAQVATRTMKPIPDGAQNFLEWLVEGLYKFLEGIIGAHLAKKTFWFFATIFIFILAGNWLGLIPGVGSIGWGHETAHGFVIDQPLLRGANADCQHDVRHGPGLFCLLDRLGSSGSWPARISEGAFRTQG